MGEENADQLHFLATVYIAIPICVFGIMGNCLSMIVWKKINSKRSDSGKSAGVYLMVLAVIDSGLLVFFLLTESLPQLYPHMMHDVYFIYFHAYVGFPFFFFFIVASIWMVVCVTINRFIAVVYPHRARQVNSTKITYTTIAATLIFSFIINIPHFFNFQLQRSNSTQSSFIYSEIKTYYGKSRSAEYYDFWAHCMVLVLVPWFTIFTLNVAIIHKLITKKKLQVNKKGESKRERQTTIILLVITISFLVFLLWQCLTQCFWMLGYGKDLKHVWFNVESAYAFARLGVVLNSSVNFILYCLTGTMFRKEMYKVFMKCSAGNYEKLESSSSTTRSISSSAASQSLSYVANNIKQDNGEVVT